MFETVSMHGFMAISFLEKDISLSAVNKRCIFVAKAAALNNADGK